MPLSEMLSIVPGEVVSIVGCNGKTSLLTALAYENRNRRVLLSTTTHIFPPQDYDRVVTHSGELNTGINLAYGGIENGKLCSLELGRLHGLCPYDGVTLLECDGSRGLPFKGWGENEPVVPRFTTLTVGVCGLWRVGELCSGANVFNTELFCALTGARIDEPVMLLHAARMISEEKGMFKNACGRKALIMNIDCDMGRDADELAGLLPPSFKAGLSVILAGSLKTGVMRYV